MTVYAFDVSHWQGQINWGKVAKKYNRGFIKATERTNFIDSQFHNNFKQATAAGIKLGAYHFSRFTNTATAIKEAEFFVSVAKNAGFTGPLCLDLEDNPGNLNKANMTAASIAFLQVIVKAGYTPVIYVNGAYYKNLIDYAKIKKETGAYLWYANPTNKPEGTPVYKCDLWQYTWTGKVDGISGDVDLNRVYTDIWSESKAPVIKDQDKVTVPTDKTETPKKRTATNGVYTVKSGDTLSEIASDFGVNITELAAWNNIKNVNAIDVGQKISVSKPKEPAKAPNQSMSVYTVKSGDTLSGIASAKKTTVKQLAALNNIANTSLIYVGQKIKYYTVSTAKPNTSKTKTYTVKSGDTLSEIAAANGTSVKTLTDLNGIKNKDVIKVGQKIKIPS